MRIKVLGAGIIGLTAAEELQRRGHDVVVVDPSPARGASYAAAGMLSPSAEVWHGEEEILRLGVRSSALWPELASRLAVPLRTEGTLLVGYDHGDLQQVERQAAIVERLGGAVELLGRRELARREPALGRVAGGALLAGDHSVDPRAVMTALLARVETGRTDPPGPWDATVLATGSTLPAPYADLVRGVRGEILRLRSDDLPRSTVRGWAGDVPVYLVPRGTEGAGGRGALVVGATSEEHDGPPAVTAGGVLRLLTAARALWPPVDRAELVETTARDRPATADHLPLIGPTERGDVVLAAGHFRHGVLLAPLTARLVADHLETGAVEPAVDPRRLSPTTNGGAER